MTGSPVWLAVNDPNLPTNISALAALLTLVWWLVRKADSADERRDGDLVKCQDTLQQMIADHRIEIAERDARIEIGRSEVHDLVDQLAPLRGAVDFVGDAADRCTCGAIDPSVKHYITRIRNEWRAT